MTSVSKSVYIDELDDMVNKYNFIYHRTNKMEPVDAVDIKSNIYIDFSTEINGKDPEFKIVDFVRISKYKNIFAKRLHSKLVQRRFCDLKS